VVAAQAERVAMVELESVAGRAAPALLVHESATGSVPLVHGSADGSRDVAGGRLHLGFREALARSLRAGEPASFEPFELHVAGFGCFPNPRHARVLWVGAREVPKPLAGLQRAIDLQMARLDYARETRPFSAHLTLGRVNDRISAAERQALTGLLDRTKIGDLGVVHVQEVILFKSDLQPGGAVYTALARAKLTDAIHE